MNMQSNYAHTYCLVSFQCCLRCDALKIEMRIGLEVDM